MPLARPRKGRRDLLDVSEFLDKLLVPFLLAHVALGDYGGPYYRDKSFRTNRVVKVFKPSPGAQSKVIGLIGTFKTLWERTPSVRGI